MRWPLPITLIALITGCGLLPQGPPRTEGDISGYQIHQTLSGYTFYKPVSIAVDSPLVFVADEGNCEIAVFDWNLNWIRNIGRKGEGPVEFRRLVAMDARDGRLATLDQHLDRLLLLSYEGIELRSLPIHFSNYGDVSFDEMGSILVTAFDYGSEFLVTHYSPELEIIANYLPDDSGLMGGMRTKSKLESANEYRICVFSFQPRMVGFGQRSFDWLYDYRKAYRWMRNTIKGKARLERRHPGTSVALPFNGGFCIHGDTAIIAGPYFYLRLVDLLTGRMSTVDLGPLATELLAHGAYTYSDVAIAGDSLLLVTKEGSCLVQLGLSDVIQAAELGKVLDPIIPN